MSQNGSGTDVQISQELGTEIARLACEQGYTPSEWIILVLTQAVERNKSIRVPLAPLGEDLENAYTSHVDYSFGLKL